MTPACDEADLCNAWLIRVRSTFGFVRNNPGELIVAVMADYRSILAEHGCTAVSVISLM